ncbi:hypothetical protein D3C71_1949550 [compost metagenome]
MSGHEHAGAQLPLRFQHLQELLDRPGIKADEGLVHNIELRLVDEADDQHQLLLHPFGETGGQVMLGTGQPETLQQFLCLRFERSLVQAECGSG